MNVFFGFFLGLIIGLSAAMGIYLILYGGTMEDMAFKDCNYTLTLTIKAIDDFNEKIRTTNAISKIYVILPNETE